MKLVNFWHSKIGRRSRARERKKSNWNIYQSPTIELKIKFTFRKRPGLSALQELSRVTARRSGRVRRYKNDSGDRKTILADQGGAVVPDGVTVHKIERPETHD